MNRTAMLVAATVLVLILCQTAGAQTHATWPADWNNWNDAALWCTVGDPGNAGELSGAGAGGVGEDRICGAVAYTYKIGKFEVTAGQYTAFLNAVAKTDTYGLYDTYMADSGQLGCRIQRSGTSGAYVYSVASDWANRPVNYVSWGDAARFANWLQNGRPNGAQGPATTEDGAYALNGATSNAALGAVTRKPGATWVLPSEDEWYKAAYYKGGSTNAGYWDYATRSDTVPGKDMADVSGNNANGRADLAPFPIESGKYTTVVGEFQNSASPYGTFDQTGNVAEWNEGSPWADSDGRDVRGGMFSDPDTSLWAALRTIGNGNDSPAASRAYIGFRVAQVPEPATLALLAAGAVALRKRRSRP